MTRHALLTVKDVATILQCSEDAVVRRFAKMPGVIDLGQSNLGVRRYRVLRIPKAVVEQYLTRKSGRSVEIDIPVRAERRRKSERWEDRAILNLAKAGLQNDAKDRKTFQRIADRARLLTAHVPENRWSEVEWFDDCDE
jgi:hypothetical protein